MYFQKLYFAFKSSAKIYYQIILAIQNNDGFISETVLASYVAAPIENVVRHKRYDLIVSKLIELRFIYKYIDGFYALSYPHVETELKNSKAIELAKKTIVEDFLDWSKKINLIAYNSSKGFFQKANFAKFQWAFSSPSYINDIANTKKHKPGFFVGDIIIGKKVEVEDVQFFIDKIEIIKSFDNIQNFVPVFLSENFSNEVYILLKTKGILCANINNLFSNAYADSLRKLIYFAKNAAAIINNDPEKFVQYISSISTLEGKMGNIIGDLFEASVGYYFHAIGCKYFEINKIIKHNNIIKEIDVYVEKDGIIKIVECKGIKNTLDHEYVEKWLSDNIPTIFKAIKETKPDATIEFELWSTGGYLKETEDLLNRVKSHTKKYSIDFLNASQIMELAKKGKCELLLKNVNSILN